jgi:hypothetical protein
MFVTGPWTDTASPYGLSASTVMYVCPSCNGVGWLPSPAVLEAMAEATHGQANDWHPPFDVCTCHKQARAAWEAQARLMLEGEK